MANCACGCGKETPLYTTTDARWGAVKGQPARFIKGHRMRRTATMDEVLNDMMRILAMTQSDEHLAGDIRSSTYFAQGMGKFSTATFHAIFPDWPTALEYIFPEGVHRRQGKQVIVEEFQPRYIKKMRSCLGYACGNKEFMSDGPEHRFCESCKLLKSYQETDNQHYDTYEINLPGKKGVLV